MRLRALLILLLALTHVTHAQRKPRIKGNRDVTEVREYLPSYKAIELDENLDIILKKATEEGYGLTIDDNLVDVLKFDVKDSTLIIDSYYTITGKKKMEITVYYRELESLVVKDGSIFVGDRINTNKLYVNTYGTSKLQLDATASRVFLNMEQNSTGIFNVDADTLGITLRDRANAEIYSTGDAIGAELRQNSGATFEGTSGLLDAQLTDHASLKASGLEAAKARLRLEASTTARIYAFDALELSAKGSSKTFLYGQPKITINSFTDTAELQKEQD